MINTHCTLPFAMKLVDEGISAQVCHEFRIIFSHMVLKSSFESILIGIEIAREQALHHSTEYVL